MELSIERNHYLIVPIDETQRIVCEKVEKACRNELMSEYKIRLNAGYTTTIACVYLESIIRILSKLMKENHGEAAVNFMDLLIVSSTNRETEGAADKDGNINIKFAPGKFCETIMERDYCPVIVPDMWKDDEIINAIERDCAHILSIKHKMSSSTTQNYTKIAFCYISYLYRTLKLMAKVAHENGKSAVMINFLEMIELHCKLDIVQNPENPDLESEKFDVKLRPGFQSKLLIKDDGITEDDFEDDDD